MPHEAVTGHGVTGGRYCPVCDGPCREPRPVFPIHEGYPFLPPEEIARVNAEVVAAAAVAAAEPASVAEPDPTPRAGRRMRRLAEDRARHLDEDRARRPAEDR